MSRKSKIQEAHKLGTILTGTIGETIYTLKLLRVGYNFFNRTVFHDKMQLHQNQNIAREHVDFHEIFQGRTPKRIVLAFSFCVDKCPNISFYMVKMLCVTLSFRHRARDSLSPKWFSLSR